MKVRVFALMAGGLVCLLFSGCLRPVRRLDLPGVSGRVVDTQSKRGIASAQIVATSWCGPGQSSASTVSAADGTFLIKPEVDWSLVFFWGAVLLSPDARGCDVTIRNSGYAPVTKRTELLRGKETTDLGVVSLRKVSRGR